MLGSLKPPTSPPPPTLVKKRRFDTKDPDLPKRLLKDLKDTPNPSVSNEKRNSLVIAVLKCKRPISMEQANDNLDNIYKFYSKPEFVYHKAFMLLGVFERANDRESYEKCYTFISECEDSTIKGLMKYIYNPFAAEDTKKPHQHKTTPPPKEQSAIKVTRIRSAMYRFYRKN